MNRTIGSDFDQPRPVESPTAAQDVTAYEVEIFADRTPLRTHVSSMLFAMILAVLVVTYFLYLKAGPQQANAFTTASEPAGTMAIYSFLAAPVDFKSMERQVRSIRLAQRPLTTPPVAQVPVTRLKTNPFRATRATTPAQLRHETVIDAVGELQLQAVLISDKNRSCTINHGIYLEGQQVDQFTIERISQGSVVVSSGTYRFELTMPR